MPEYDDTFLKDEHAAEVAIRFPGFLRRLLPPLIAVGILLIAVRLVLVTAGIWLPIEYRMPGFPADTYGFSMAERIKWAQVDIDYLVDGDLSIDFYDALKLESGEPMHNERELSHMEDVKILVNQAWMVAKYGLLISVILLGALAYLESPVSTAIELQRGARLTFIIMAILVAGVLIGFTTIFVGFHNIFFAADTWLFRYSDTFIRLFPERFWRDSFIMVGAFASVLAGSLVWVGGWLKK